MLTHDEAEAVEADEQGFLAAALGRVVVERRAAPILALRRDRLVVLVALHYRGRAPGTSRAEPSRAVPCRAAGSRSEPSRAEPRRRRARTPCAGEVLPAPPEPLPASPVGHGRRERQAGLPKERGGENKKKKQSSKTKTKTSPKKKNNNPNHRESSEGAASEKFAGCPKGGGKVLEEKPG